MKKCVCWASRPTVQLSQSERYADTLMQLSGKTQSSSARTTSPRSTKRGGYNDRQQNLGRKSFRSQCEKVHAIVTPAESPSTGEIENAGTYVHGKTLGAALLATPQVSHCRECLACKHTMTECLYTVNGVKSAATREASWQMRSAARFRGLFRLSWQGTRQSDAQKA